MRRSPCCPNRSRACRRQSAARSFQRRGSCAGSPALDHSQCTRTRIGAAWCRAQPRLEIPLTAPKYPGQGEPTAAAHNPKCEANVELSHDYDQALSSGPAGGLPALRPHGRLARPRRSRAASSGNAEGPASENLLDRAVSTFERNFIIRALEKSRWNVTATARALGQSADARGLRSEVHAVILKHRFVDTRDGRVYRRGEPDRERTVGA